jgi:H+-transporting ATPase
VGLQTYAGALVRRGEATAIVTATGANTKFGHTAELVRTAHVESTQQKTVVRVVRNLAIFNGVIILVLVAYAHARKMPIGEIIPLVLTGVLASIQVALPATFTLAAALGAKALARLGVLPTRLEAVDEAATLDVLCSDKTGTLTCNELGITGIRPEPGFDEAQVPPQIDQIRSVRSGDKNVRGNSGRREGRHAACSQGSVCGGHQIDRPGANSGRDGARTRR